MLTIYEFDEVLGDCILRDNSSTKEEYINNNAYDEEDTVELSKEWDLAQLKYKEYLNTYENEIGSELSGEWNEGLATCRFCGHKQKLPYYETYYDNYGTFNCDNCCKDNKFEIEKEHEYAEEFTVRTLRPSCNKRSEHLWIKQKEREGSNHFHEMSKFSNKFPHSNAVKYTCIKCGEDRYVPLKDDGTEFSKRSIKRLNRKYKKGYSKSKTNITLYYVGDYKSQSIEMYDSDEDVKNRLGRVMSDFRKRIKRKFTYNPQTEDFVFDTPFEDKKITVPKFPYWRLFRFSEPTNSKEELFMRNLIHKLEKSMNKYGIKFIKKHNGEKLCNKPHEFVGKDVVVREWSRGNIIFRGICIGSDGYNEVKVKGKYQDKTIITDIRKVELLTSNTSKVKIKDKVRIERAVSCLKKFSSEWEFLKANRVKTYLNRIGYSK